MVEWACKRSRQSVNKATETPKGNNCEGQLVPPLLRARYWKLYTHAFRKSHTYTHKATQLICGKSVKRKPFKEFFYISKHCFTNNYYNTAENHHYIGMSHLVTQSYTKLMQPLKIHYTYHMALCYSQESI